MSDLRSAIDYRARMMEHLASKDFRKDQKDMRNLDIECRKALTRGDAELQFYGVTISMEMAKEILGYDPATPRKPVRATTGRL